MVYCDAIIALADKERATGSIYQELCKAFNVVLHDRLPSNWRDVDVMDGALGG